jgi:ABC-type multidrug transport system permease subunit
MRKLPATLAQLLLWSLRDFLREPAALFWTLGFPILMTLTLGQMTSQAHGLRANVAVLAEPAEQAQADAWIAAHQGDGSIQWKRLAPQELPTALVTGKVRLGLEHAWDAPARRWRFDPADSQALLAYHLLRDRLDGHVPDAEPLHVPGARYIDFLLPGLLALGLVNSCLWGVGWGLIEMREKRLLRLMLATPLDPGAFFGAQFAGRLILSLLESGALLAFSAALFHVRVQGSLPALLTLWTCGVAGFFGVAVLVGSRTAKSSIGQGLINAVTIPMFVISGVFFGLDNFPPLLQSVFRAFPPTLMVDATRQVMNTPAGWAEVAPACGALLAMGALCYGVGRRWFRFY